MKNYVMLIAFLIVCLCTHVSSAMNSDLVPDVKKLARIKSIQEFNQLQFAYTDLKEQLDKLPSVDSLCADLNSLVKEILTYKPNISLVRLATEIARDLEENRTNAFWFDQAVSLLTNVCNSDPILAGYSIRLRMLKTSTDIKENIAKQAFLCLIETNVKKLECAKLYELHEMQGTTPKVLVNANRDMWNQLRYDFDNPWISKNEKDAFLQNFALVRAKTKAFMAEKSIQLIDELIQINADFAKLMVPQLAVL